MYSRVFAFFFLAISSVQIDLTQASEQTAEFNLEALQAILAKKKPTSIEQTLPLLPKSFRNNVILMHTSQSLQDASFENPRVILFSENARFVMSFNGSPTQFGSQNLELIQFRDTTNQFEFREIQFASNKAKLSTPNPRVCLGCHGGQNPRPNWEPYNEWPGAFGSIGAGIGDPSRQQNSMTELKPYVDFIKNKMAHPRYQYIGDAHDSYTEDSQNQFYHLENLSTLTQKMAYLNFRRLNQIIFDQSYYKTIRLALLGITACGLSAEQVLPPNLFQSHRLRKKTQYESSGKEGVIGSHESNFFLDQINTLFEPLGLSTKLWSMDIGSGGIFSASHRFRTPSSEAELEWAETLLQMDPELAEFTNYSEWKSYFFRVERFLPPLFGRSTHENPNSFDCQKLAQESRQSRFNVLPASPLPTAKIPDLKFLYLDQKNTPRALGLCTSCHASGNPKIPAIPFDQPKNLKIQYPALSEILRRLEPNAGSDKMPPTPLEISKADQELLTNWFNAVYKNTDD